MRYLFDNPKTPHPSRASNEIEFITCPWKNPENVAAEFSAPEHINQCFNLWLM